MKQDKLLRKDDKKKKAKRRSRGPYRKSAPVKWNKSLH